MKKVIRLTESDLSKIIKKIISENDMDVFFRRRIGKYSPLIDYKMREILPYYCKGSKKLKKTEEFVERIKNFMYEHIERFDMGNFDFNPYFEDYNNYTKEFEKAYNLIYKEKVEKFFKENCKLRSRSSNQDEEVEYSISNLNQYKYKSETKSVDEIIEDYFNEFVTTHDLDSKAFKSFDDFALQVVSAFVVRPTLRKFNFKGNLTKEKGYHEFLNRYVIKKYKQRLKEYFTR